MKKGFGKISAMLDSEEGEMARALARMISIKAIAPSSGGAGEGRRADYLERMLKGFGAKVKRYSYKDETGTDRPNLVAKLGNAKRTLWIIAHIDTVSEGDISLWHRDPFKGAISGGRVYGRGSNDNGQEVIASIFAFKALKQSGIGLKYNLGVVLAADEETTSRYGVRSLIREGLFKRKDIMIVPDYGDMKGDKIEIAEKSVLWLKFTFHGRQVHGSRPGQGVNSYRYAIRFLDYLDGHLHRRYGKSDTLFAEPRSTFEMTKHEKNVDSVNIIPGTEVSYMDCRLLPVYSADKVVEDIRKIARRKEFAKAKIEVGVFGREEAPATSEKSEVVKMLKKAVFDLRRIRAKCVGTGGGTVAKPFRKRGIQVAVWSTQHDMAHEPDEYAVIKYMAEDAKVFAYLCI